MKKLSLSLCLVAVIYLLFINQKSAEVPQPHERISIHYKEGVHEFVYKVNILKTAAASFQGAPRQLEQLHTLFKEARYAYKKIECFSAYMDYYSTGMLNGPNLPKIEYEQNEPFSYHQATGLQVLEEALYADEIPHRDTLMLILNEMENPLRTLKSQTLGYVLTDDLIFDAFRHQTLRIFALGLSGFDSPVSLNSLREAKAALEALQQYYGFYQKNIEAMDAAKFKAVNLYFDEAQSYLIAHDDFNKFDRVHFLKNYLDPLLVSFIETERLLGIVPMDKVLPNRTALYSQAKSLFAADLVKPYFFHVKQIDKPKEGMVALGKLLFFDPILSVNNERACASCHNPNKAFTDSQVTSTALDFNGRLKRNAPTLLNVGLQQKFQWDARAYHLEDQFVHVMFSADEMGGSATLLQRKLNQSQEYKRMFQEVFQLSDKDHITYELAFAALASYLRTINTFNAPFDRYMRGEVKQIDPEVIQGFNVFMGKAKCGTCHFAPVFNGTIPPDFTQTESEVLGLTQSADFKHPVLDSDPGRYIVGNVPEHRHSFKTPTLRNIALTAPYMHNGAFKTLEEVMTFYNQGGGVGMG
ncbi:MAG TPA: cytochrome c peroxidase, partial [Cytophagales bacterium]|nr:cytochrome c peroxidase [Cytophagales bacterium]